MGKKKAPKHAMYSTMKDTPWISQARDISEAGGKGVLGNYQNINVFNPETQRSLEARNNATYNRAFSNMNDNYTKIMNNYAAKNYGQFGTLNSTPSAYVTDQYRKDFQRQMDDMSYQKAANYDTLMDNELSRRYNTFNMFRNMYDVGQNAYAHDKMNWNTMNTNKDIAYQNALAGSQGGWQSALAGAGTGALAGLITTGNPAGAIAGGIAGGVGGYYQ